MKEEKKLTNFKRISWKNERKNKRKSEKKDIFPMVLLETEKKEKRKIRVKIKKDA